MAINNLNPRRTIWYSTHEPSNKYDLWLCPSTATHDADGNPINPKCVYDLKIFECGKWKVINFCHCNGGDDPSHYIPVQDIEIIPDPLNMEVGESKSLSCIFTPSDATNKKVVWSVLNGGTARPIISIDKNGVVTASASGNATVVVTSEDNPEIQDTASVKVTSSSGGTTYTVSVAANPTNGGTVTGGGTYTENTSCTVTATANSGYTFSYWRIGTDTYYESSKTFTVTNNINCTAYFVQNATKPTVVTTSATPVSQNSANCVGEITSTGNSEITERGFCYGTSANPTISGDHWPVRSLGVGTFDATITGLSTNTTYHVRAYAKNSAGVGYGADKSFTTLNTSLPTVVTKTPTEIDHESAVSGGNVTNNGGSAVTDKGICWSTNSNPTTADSNQSGGTGLGGFTITMESLTADTTYYVRAYATNSYGTAYGSQKSFKTKEQAGPADIPTIYVGQVKGMSTQDFKNLSDAQIMDYYRDCVSTNTMTYSSDEWNGSDYYLVFFLIKQGYTIQNTSNFVSLGISQPINWDFGGLRSIVIGGTSYVLYTNRRRFNSSDSFTINIA